MQMLSIQMLLMQIPAECPLPLKIEDRRRRVKLEFVSLSLSLSLALPRYFDAVALTSIMSASSLPIVSAVFVGVFVSTKRWGELCVGLLVLHQAVASAGGSDQRREKQFCWWDFFWASE